MKIVPVDERTAEWELDTPLYRVYFWERGKGPAEASGVGYGLKSYEISGAGDVFEVIAWANAHSGPGRGEIYSGSDRSYVIYAVADRHVRKGIVRLIGVDPDRAPDVGEIE
jgi:hypothetical protein